MGKRLERKPLLERCFRQVTEKSSRVSLHVKQDTEEEREPAAEEAS